MKKRNAHNAGGSARRREQARLAISRWNVEVRPFLKRCGARRKSDGQPCQQLAMENGRCYVHGGRTPKGDGWHKPRWPNRGAPVEKLNRKLRMLDRARKEREQRIAAMTDEERAQYEFHQEWRQPGPKAKRDEKKRKVLDAIRVQAILNKPQPNSDEAARLDRIIAKLELQIAEIEQQVETGETVFD